MGGGGKKLDTFLIYPFILPPFPTEAQKLLKYCLQSRFFIYLTYRGLNYCILVEHCVYVFRYTVCNYT